MNEKLQAYLERKKSNRICEEKAKRDAYLLKIGLYNKEYSNENGPSQEYPDYEIDQTTQAFKYFRKVPIDVTDEEYAELLKYKDAEKQQNRIAQIFRVIAWVTFVAGFIVGLIFGRESGFLERLLRGYNVFELIFEYGYSLDFSVFLYWCAAFISGMVHMAVAEVVQLLSDINRKLDKE
ncbi:MAG: hypothetical protein IKM36_02460 [Oscillospiraceae bacterium]|nr:hypothetical protein [Oscillospiraceae bacterium]MBR3849335.1 hypothetical protein [Oscillospiraceae bacterium]